MWKLIVFILLVTENHATTPPTEVLVSSVEYNGIAGDKATCDSMWEHLAPLLAENLGGALVDTWALSNSGHALKIKHEAHCEPWKSGAT